MFATYQRLGVSIWESETEVIRAASLKLRHRFDRSERVNRHAFYRQMLKYHRLSRNLALELSL